MEVPFISLLHPSEDFRVGFLGVCATGSLQGLRKHLEVEGEHCSVLVQDTPEPFTPTRSRVPREPSPLHSPQLTWAGSGCLASSCPPLPLPQEKERVLTTSLPTPRALPGLGSSAPGLPTIPEAFPPPTPHYHGPWLPVTPGVNSACSPGGWSPSCPAASHLFPSHYPPTCLWASLS